MIMHSKAKSIWNTKPENISSAQLKEVQSRQRGLYFRILGIQRGTPGENCAKPGFLLQSAFALRKLQVVSIRRSQSLSSCRWESIVKWRL